MTAPATAAVLEQVAAAAAPFGVRRFGCCPLGALSRRLPCRRGSALPPRGSVLLLLLPFYAGEFPERNVARYALCDDYHAIAGEILSAVVRALERAFPEGRFWPFVDSSPIPEVEAACLAGLGFAGRNGQLITPEYGSLAFVCEIVTDLELAPTIPEGKLGSCGSCRRCLEACPTSALSQWGLDAALCRSHITQKKGDLTPGEEEQLALGGMAWGCDVCTGVCPHNRHPALSTIPRMLENLTPVLTREELPRLAACKSYGWRGEKVLLRNLAILEQAKNKE